MGSGEGDESERESEAEAEAGRQAERPCAGEESVAGQCRARVAFGHAILI